MLDPLAPSDFPELRHETFSEFGDALFFGPEVDQLPEVGENRLVEAAVVVAGDGFDVVDAEVRPGEVKDVLLGVLLERFVVLLELFDFEFELGDPGLVFG